MADVCPRQRLKTVLPAALPAPVDKLRRPVIPTILIEIIINKTVSLDFTQLVA